ncbi:SDR family oxidoreductase [Luteococcus peritonei]|uniref:SDR family NAD(P)-dependent oxidoreductase n=1 Tax=Luteococcus peritonei TaxID=88874 RepID=A0ABW4RSX9_9ACTN
MSTRPVALVAGASRGLGLLLALELGRRGHDVAICARDEQALARAAEQIRREVPETTVLTRACDVSDEAALRAFVDSTEAELGPVEVAIHVAGIIQVGPWQATRREHFEQAVDVMLWGPVNLALEVLPRMTGRGHGRFAVVTSIGGRVSPPRLLPYSVAKFGAVGLTEGLAAELAGTGVTATTIVPGLMRTGSHTRASFFGDAARQYAWFGPAASLPLLSMDAERAASQMVSAVLAGRPVAHISPLSQVATRVHGLAPGLTVRAMGLASRLLPTGDSPQTEEGRTARARLGSSLVDRLTTLGDRAGHRTNEH